MMELVALQEEKKICLPSSSQYRTDPEIPLEEEKLR